MTVFVVVECYYEGYEIAGVFSTEVLANEYTVNNEAHSGAVWDIDAREVDARVPQGSL